MLRHPAVGVTENAAIRELFVEELEEVKGGEPLPNMDSTMACCEELIFDRCCLGP